MLKKIMQPIKTQFDPKSQPGYESRFGNFAFNRFFGDLKMGKVSQNSNVRGASAKVVSDAEFYGSRQIPQVSPSKAYKKGNTP